MDLRFNHDEHQFIASGVLLAQEGLLPYRDYPHFHMPNLVLVNALLFRLTDYYLLAARTLSVLSGWLLLVALYFTALRLFRNTANKARFLIGAGMVLLLGASPMLVYTSGRAWNHDLPALLSMGAFLLLVYGLKRPPSLLWLGLSGFLAGFAASTRLTAILLAAPLFLAIWLWPNQATLRQRLWGGLVFVLGVLLASLPAIYFFAFDRDKFLFGNLEYAWLNTQYRATEGYALRMTLPDKLVYFGFDVLLKRPGNLLVALAYLLLGLPLLKRGAPGRAELLLIGGLLAAAAAGALGAHTQLAPVLFHSLPVFCRRCPLWAALCAQLVADTALVSGCQPGCGGACHGFGGQRPPRSRHSGGASQVAARLFARHRAEDRRAGWYRRARVNPRPGAGAGGRQPDLPAARRGTFPAARRAAAGTRAAAGLRFGCRR